MMARSKPKKRASAGLSDLVLNKIDFRIRNYDNIKLSWQKVKAYCEKNKSIFNSIIMPMQRDNRVWPLKNTAEWKKIETYLELSSFYKWYYFILSIFGFGGKYQDAHKKSFLSLVYDIAERLVGVASRGASDIGQQIEKRSEIFVFKPVAALIDVAAAAHKQSNRPGASKGIIRGRSIVMTDLVREDCSGGATGVLKGYPESNPSSGGSLLG